MSAQSRKPPAGTTIAAAILIFVETALYLVGAIYFLAVGFGMGDESGPLAGNGRVDVELIRGTLVFIGALILAICAAAIVAGVNVLRRRVWARWMAAGMFSLFALITLVATFARESLGGASVTGGGLNMVHLIAQVGVIVLLLVSPTARDFRAAQQPPEQTTDETLGEPSGGGGG